MVVTVMGLWVKRLVSAVALTSLLIGNAFAQEPEAPAAATEEALPPIETAATFAEIMDYDTGAVLFSKSSDQLMKPASMAKLMTVAVIFQKLKTGELKLDDKLTVSASVWNQFARDKEASKMFVGLGEAIRIEDLIRGILVVSGNDACAVVAEGLAGSEEKFAELMNAEARRIGMTQSTFANSSGMPDPSQNVTAHELALLARHLIKDYPEYYDYFGEREFTWNKITQPNRDLLLASYPGADGLKTGHTGESGYGITASAKQNGRRVIVVVNGLPSVEARAAEAKRLLDIGFQEFKTYALVKPGDTVGRAQIWAGEYRAVPLVVRQSVSILMRAAARDRLRVTVSFNEPVLPPVARGAEMGKLTVHAPGIEPVSIPVYAGTAVGQGSIVTRLKAGFKLLMATVEDEPVVTLRLKPQPQAQPQPQSQPSSQ